VVWLDSAGPVRLVKLRTLPGGADQVVKVDTGAAGGSAMHAHLFDGGVLLWDSQTHVFEWRAGTLTFFSSAVSPGGSPLYVNGPWAAWTSAEARAGVRRNLPAGTSVPVPEPWGVGPNGEILSAVVGATRIWNNGVITSYPWPDCCGIAPPLYTDGVGAAYRMETNIIRTAWLSTPTVQERLATANINTGNGYVNLRFDGGWAAWDVRFSTATTDSVARRSPAGVREVLTSGQGGRLVEVSPTGTVVFTQYGLYYLAQVGAPSRPVGPTTPRDVVLWRDNRFVLISGGSVYALSP